MGCVPYIVDFVWGLCCGAPANLGLRSAVHYSQQPSDYVVYKGKVALRIAVVKYVNRLTSQNFFGKAVVGHVRSTPWAINSEKS